MYLKTVTVLYMIGWSMLIGYILYMTPNISDVVRCYCIVTEKKWKRYKYLIL